MLHAFPMVCVGAIAGLLVGLGEPARATTPSINCRYARSDVEQVICANASFVAMDREIAALYDRGLAEFGPRDRHRLADTELEFLQARDQCAAHDDVERCVGRRLERRVRELRDAVEAGGF